jgi:methylated-DNA-[protein]-cysteine S-methyltransferase
LPATTATIQNHYAVFETGIGWIGLAWNGKGLTRLQLPERDRAATERRLLWRLSGAVETAPTGEMAAVVDALRRYAAGEAVDFSGVPVDLSEIEPFRVAIYDAARQLGFGETTTYGELAARAGHAGLARETGQALGSNPVAIIIPCHRILAAGGKIGGFSAPGGSAAKERLLAMEGVRVGPPPPAQASFGF